MKAEFSSLSQKEPGEEKVKRKSIKIYQDILNSHTRKVKLAPILRKEIRMGSSVYALPQDWIRIRRQLSRTREEFEGFEDS